MKLLFTNLNDAREMIDALLEKFPELQKNPRAEHECIGKLCCVSGSFDFTKDFSPDEFINGLIDGDIYITYVKTNSVFPFKGEILEKCWSFAVPCNTLKIQVSK